MCLDHWSLRDMLVCYQYAFQLNHDTFELLILPEDTSYLGWLAILVSRSLLCLDFFHSVVVQCCRDQQAIYLLELNTGCSLYINSMYICQEVGRHGAVHAGK